MMETYSVIRGVALAVGVILASGGIVFAADNSEEKAPPAHLTNPFKGQDDIIPKGRTLFNIHCSHCHGPNAAQAERVRDLRRLSIRYREDIEEVFITTAFNGRPEKGMPAWRDVVEEEELWKIFTFLNTVQKQKKKRKR